MKKFFVLMITITFLLSGCDAGYSITSAGASGFDNALAVIQVGVPYIGAMDLRLDTIKLLETDSYGRSLFIYEMGLSSVKTLLIIQKTENSFVYYYEDTCYSILNNEADSFASQDIDTLKNNNDWNNPLDENRMTTINYSDNRPDLENIDNYFDVCKLILKQLEQRYPEKNWEAANISLNGLESHKDSGQVILAQAHFSESNVVEFYLFLYSPNRQEAVQNIERIDGFYDVQEHIKSFKDSYCR